MEDNKNTQADELSEEQLKEVAGGANNVHQRHLERLDNQSDKSVDDIQKTRLEHLDNQSK
jgi:hypothetical protein